MAHHRIVLEPDGPGSYKFKFATERGEISGRVRVGLEGPPDNRSEADQEQAALNQQREARTLVDEVEVTRSGRTDQFSIVLVRGGDTIRCMVSVALGGTDERSDSEKHRAALSKAKALAKALDSAIES